MPSALLTALVMSPAAAKNQANYGKKWRYMRGNMSSLFYLDVYDFDRYNVNIFITLVDTLVLNANIFNFLQGVCQSNQNICILSVKSVKMFTTNLSK